MNRGGEKYRLMWSARCTISSPEQRRTEKGENRVGLSKVVPLPAKMHVRPGNFGPEMFAGLLTVQFVKERFIKAGKKRWKFVARVMC
jgi:hypothetical protein